ncbi:MAG: hypothetical protein NZ923_03785 [Candidatus Kryptonium sp.]|nr:hypothetical protein [Candidatus Kryptonium sp.]
MMLKKFALFVLFLLILNYYGASQNIWFSDEFNSSKIRNLWTPISGSIELADGKLKLRATDKPSLVALNLPIPPKSRYTVKFSFSGSEISLLFNIYDIYSIRVGNYVKFFNNAIYTGVVEASGEEKIVKFASLPQVKNRWKTLAVEVTPERYSVYFNDKKVFDGELYFNSGFIILSTKLGDVEIDYFIISSREKYKRIEELRKEKEALIIDHVNSIALIDSSKFAISSDIYSHVQVLDTIGNVLNRFTYLRWAGGVMHYNEGLYVCDAGRIIVVYPDKTVNVAQFMVKYPTYISNDGEKFYVIDDGAIKIFDRSFKIVASFADPANLKFPTAVAADKYNLYCADPELGQISVYSKRDTIRFTRKIKDVLIKPVDIKYDSTLNCFFVADIGLKGVAKLVNDKVERVFRAENLGGLKLPRSIDLKSGLIFIADADKIVRVDTTLSEYSARLILRR